MQKTGYRNLLLPKKWDSTPQNLTTPLLQQTAPLLFPTEEQPPLPIKSLQLWRVAVFVFWTEWHSVLPSVVLGKYRQVLRVLAVTCGLGGKKVPVFEHGQKSQRYEAVMIIRKGQSKAKRATLPILLWRVLSGLSWKLGRWKRLQLVHKSNMQTLYTVHPK